MLIKLSPFVVHMAQFVENPSPFIDLTLTYSLALVRLSASRSQTKWARVGFERCLPWYSIVY